MPQDWNYGTDRLGGASMGLDSGWRGFERYRLFFVSAMDFINYGANKTLVQGNERCLPNRGRRRVSSRRIVEPRRGPSTHR